MSDGADFLRVDVTRVKILCEENRMKKYPLVFIFEAHCQNILNAPRT